MHGGEHVHSKVSLSAEGKSRDALNAVELAFKGRCPGSNLGFFICDVMSAPTLPSGWMVRVQRERLRVCHCALYTAGAQVMSNPPPQLPTLSIHASTRLETGKG